MRPVWFRLHWLLGLTLGGVLAFSGLTGALQAFGPELSDWSNGGYTHMDAHGAAPLPVQELHDRALHALPGRRLVEITTYADSTRPARVRLAVTAPFIGPTAPIAETRMADPYNGELLPVRPFGRRVERFMWWLHEVHQGHWGGPRDRLAWWGPRLVGSAAVTLFIAALSGLYLRWPRGKAARSWRSWLWIHSRLKGRVFLFNLHAVLGTCALLAFLVSAHSGVFQNQPMAWYHRALQLSLGVPPLPPFQFPHDDSSIVALIHVDNGGYFDADGDVERGSRATLDLRTGRIAAQPAGREPATLGQKLDAWNQLIHEGRIAGRTGTAYMMLAALALPVFYVTGWLMYLRRARWRPITSVRTPSDRG
jgi:sulfite reductase (NADPH) flavoprotein alpha-component